MTQSTVRLGILSPATPNRPHFKSFEAILPAGVAMAHDGLGLLGESYQDLAGKEDVIITHGRALDRKSTRLNSSHMSISYAVFCLKKKNNSSTYSWYRVELC